jgi:hypothetical protein
MNEESFEEIKLILSEKQNSILRITDGIPVPSNVIVRRQLSGSIDGPDPGWLIQDRQVFFSGRTIADLVNDSGNVDFCLPLMRGQVLRYYQWYFIDIFFQGVYWAVSSYLDGSGLYLETEVDYPMIDFVISNKLYCGQIGSCEEREASIVFKLAKIFSDGVFLMDERNDNLDKRLHSCLLRALKK